MEQDAYAEYTEYLESSEKIQYYVDNLDEYEWFQFETQSLKQYCDTHNLPLYRSQYSLRSFIHPEGKYPWKAPTSNLREQIDWYIHWHRIYNDLVQKHTAHLKYLKDKEEREMENKIYDALNLWWESLQDCCPAMYWQFKRNAKNPHIAAEIKKQQTLFVYTLLYEGKNLFDTVV